MNNFGAHHSNPRLSHKTKMNDNKIMKRVLENTLHPSGQAYSEAWHAYHAIRFNLRFMLTADVAVIEYLMRRDFSFEYFDGDVNKGHWHRFGLVAAECMGSELISKMSVGAQFDLQKTMYRCAKTLKKRAEAMELEYAARSKPVLTGSVLTNIRVAEQILHQKECTVHAKRVAAERLRFNNSHRWMNKHIVYVPPPLPVLRPLQSGKRRAVSLDYAELD